MRAEKLPYSEVTAARLPQAKIAWRTMKNQYINSLSGVLQKIQPKLWHSFFVWRLADGDISAPLLKDLLSSLKVKSKKTNYEDAMFKHLGTELSSYQGLERVLVGNDPIAQFFKPQCRENGQYIQSDVFITSRPQVQQAIEVLAHIFSHKPNVGHARKLLASIKATNSLDVRIQHNLKNLIDKKSKAISQVPKILGQPCFDDYVSSASRSFMQDHTQPQNFSGNRTIAQMLSDRLRPWLPKTVEPIIQNLGPTLLKSSAEISNTMTPYLPESQGLQAAWQGMQNFTETHVQKGMQYFFDGKNHVRRAVNQQLQRADGYVLTTFQQAFNHAFKQSKPIAMDDWVQVVAPEPETDLNKGKQLVISYIDEDYKGPKAGAAKQAQLKEMLEKQRFWGTIEKNSEKTLRTLESVEELLLYLRSHKRSIFGAELNTTVNEKTTALMAWYLDPQNPEAGPKLKAADVLPPSTYGGSQGESMSYIKGLLKGLNS